MSRWGTASAIAGTNFSQNIPYLNGVGRRYRNEKIRPHEFARDAIGA